MQRYGRCQVLQWVPFHRQRCWKMQRWATGKPRFPTSIRFHPFPYLVKHFIWILTCLAMSNAERSKERITQRLGAFWCWAGPSCAAWLEISWDFRDQTKSSQAYTQPYSLFIWFIRIISHIKAPWQPVLNALRGTNCVFLCCFSLLDHHFLLTEFFQGSMQVSAILEEYIYAPLLQGGLETNSQGWLPPEFSIHMHEEWTRNDRSVVCPFF